MSDTKPSALSSNDINRIVEALQTHGAQIAIQDPRVSSAQNWLLATIGGAIILVGAWLIKSVNELNTTMAEVVTTNRYFSKNIEDNRADIRDHAHRLDVLEAQRK